MTEWYDELFDDRYLEFYDGVLEAPLAEAEAEFLDLALSCPRGARMLDLGRGFGRHAVPMAARGYDVTGVELSPTMLRYARERAASRRVDATWVERDMRDLDGLGPFDACLCLYTVFGYFDDDGNARVLEAVRDALVPGGALVLDVTNPLALLPRWPGESWREVAAGVAREAVEFDAVTSRLTAQRTLFRCGSAGARAKVELPSSSVRMYPPGELRALLERLGFEIEQLHGGLGADRPFRWKRSVQQVWIARKPDRR